MSKTIIAYTQEVMPLFRALEHQQDLLKDFKETDEGAQGIIEQIKELQDDLKAYLEGNDDSKVILDNIKDINNDIKQAVKASLEVFNKEKTEDSLELKAPDLKAYYKARSKLEVKKHIEKGMLFNTIDVKIACG